MAGTIDFRWDPLELAADQTYSTTIRVEVTRWWEAGAPRGVSVSVRQPGEDLPPGRQVLVQRGKAIFPLTGLQPKHHYLVVVTGEDRPVEKFIPVPELPKPKTPEQEALELERTQLERARVYSERKKLAAQERKPTSDEKRTVALKAKTEWVKAEKDLKEAERKEAPHPTDFSVEKFGDNGKYKLLIFVFLKEKPESAGVGVPEAAVTIMDRHASQSWETKTGPGGTVIFEVPEFTESEKIISAIAEGLPFVKDRQLLGPPAPVHP